jgi:hypothetical protein
MVGRTDPQEVETEHKSRGHYRVVSILQVDHWTVATYQAELLGMVLDSVYHLLFRDYGAQSVSNQPTFPVALLIRTSFRSLRPLLSLKIVDEHKPTRKNRWQNLRVHTFFGSESIFHASKAGSALIAFLARFLTFCTRSFDLDPFRTDSLDGTNRIHVHGYGRGFK